MAISDKLKIANEEKTQLKDFFKARAIIMPLQRDAVRIKAEVQAIIDAGTFNMVDPELKAVGVKAVNVVNQIVAAFEEAEVAEFLNWRP